MSPDGEVDEQGGSKLPHSKSFDWPHAPIHRLAEAGTYIVSAATQDRALLFTDGPQLRMLHGALLTLAVGHGWQLEAWAVFSNHYHFVGHFPPGEDTGAGSLVGFLRELHSRTARALNRHEHAENGRRVWGNYFDTQLTHERSYLARLNYVRQNAVHHGLVAVARDYPWSSAAWFERAASPAQVKTIYGFKTDRINVPEFGVRELAPTL